jgi:predicted 3-demethylubiquinone-9 3-methyltransferase (glyoxalase superfamily)
MTRREEIEQQASLTVFPWDDVREQSKFEEGFIEGAKWADKTMIEKACEWLNDNFGTSWELDCYGCYTNETEVTTSFDTKEEMMESFHKAMEE